MRGFLQVSQATPFLIDSLICFAAVSCFVLRVGNLPCLALCRARGDSFAVSRAFHLFFLVAACRERGTNECSDSFRGLAFCIWGILFVHMTFSSSGGSMGNDVSCARI